ncbi:hypothetical protein [Streptomyces finlayi]|uniref:hypothetical protein n=1 Tax=Streptomyces finlayi TaxID=67296 RepID=UPI001624D08B|nr:hypothetical protein [Streptomyces finlayi]
MTSTDPAEAISGAWEGNADAVPCRRTQDLGMSTGGMIECRPGARLWGRDDEDSIWQPAIDLFLLNRGNAYGGPHDVHGTAWPSATDAQLSALLGQAGQPSRAVRASYRPTSQESCVIEP